MDGPRALTGWMAFLVMLSSLATGCEHPLLRVGAARSAEDAATDDGWNPFRRTPKAQPSGSPRGEPVVLQLQFDVMRVELPLDAIRHSTKIWNHVNELQLDPPRCALFARNGMRIGVADADVWPAIQAVLEAQRAMITRQQHAVQSGYPLILDLGPARSDEAYFYYDRDGRLTGTTFGEGSKYLNIGYAVDPVNPQRVTLEVTPEVHCESPDKRWTERDGIYYQESVYQGQRFSDLTATLTVMAGQFLVIGPSEAAGTGSLLGSRFLHCRDGGGTKEVLLLVAPQPFRTATAER